MDSVLGLTKVTPAVALALDHPLALNSSNYQVTPQNQLPANEQDKTARGMSMFLMSHKIAPGSKGHFWFLQVGIKYLEDQDSKTTMLLGLASLMDIFPDALDRFAVHPLDKSSSLPPLTSNKLVDGFPSSAVLVVKDKCNRQANQQTAAPLSQPSPHRHNNEEGYKPPMSLGEVMHVIGKGNVKEACEVLAWDMVDTGLQVQWKDHQSPDSSAQVLLMNVPPVLDRVGVECQILWHLAEIEKSLLKKGLLPMEYIGVPLPNINLLWRQNKQGKGKNKAKKNLSLNKLAAFQDNGCLVCAVEALEGSWPRLGPLWEAFHKMGLNR